MTEEHPRRRFLCYHPESDSLFVNHVFEPDGLVEDVTGIPEFEERYAREEHS